MNVKEVKADLQERKHQNEGHEVSFILSPPFTVDTFLILSPVMSPGVVNHRRRRPRQSICRCLARRVGAAGVVEIN